MIVNNIELDDSSSRSSLLLDGGGGERKRRIAGEWLGGASSVSSPRSCSCGSPATLIGIHRHLVSVTARESEREKKKFLKRLASATCLLALHVRLSTQNEMLIFKKQILIFLSKRIMLISNIFLVNKKTVFFFHPLLICAFKIPKNHLKFLLENNKNNSLKNLRSYVLKN